MFRYLNFDFVEHELQISMIQKLLNNIVLFQRCYKTFTYMYVLQNCDTNYVYIITMNNQFIKLYRKNI